MKDLAHEFKYENKKHFECVKNIKYVFSLQQAHMYNFDFFCQIDGKRYSAMCEFAATRECTMLIWVEDFNFPLGEVENVKTAMESCLLKNEIKPMFCAGSRIP